MRTKKVPAPTLGRKILVRLSSTTIRPANVYQSEGDRVFASVDGPALNEQQSLSATSYNPRKNCVGGCRYGEESPGIPALDRWCWPPMVRDEIEVEDLLSE